MYYHPETLLLLAYETRHGLLEEAERYRLLASARRHRRQARRRARRTAGTLAACAPAALPAR